MENSSKVIGKLRLNTEASIENPSKHLQVLAKLEALLLRTENQKVKEKSQDS